MGNLGSGDLLVDELAAPVDSFLNGGPVASGDEIAAGPESLDQLFCVIARQMHTLTSAGYPLSVTSDVALAARHILRAAHLAEAAKRSNSLLPMMVNGRLDVLSCKLEDTLCGKMYYVA